MKPLLTLLLVLFFVGCQLAVGFDRELILEDAGGTGGEEPHFPLPDGFRPGDFGPGGFDPDEFDPGSFGGNGSFGGSANGFPFPPTAGTQTGGMQTGGMQDGGVQAGSGGEPEGSSGGSGGQ